MKLIKHPATYILELDAPAMQVLQEALERDYNPQNLHSVRTRLLKLFSEAKDIYGGEVNA